MTWTDNAWFGSARERGSETADLFLKDALNEEQRKKIRFASCDMSKVYLVFFIKFIHHGYP
jgi:hypothetical protein